MDERWQVISSTQRFAGRAICVRTDTVQLPDATTTQFDVVEHPGAYAIVAMHDDRIVLVRQYRHPAGRTLWEIPAGTAEPGETPDVGARRELAEETGYTADVFEPMFSLYTTPGFCDELMHFFCASSLRAGPQMLDGDERIDVGLFTLDEADAMLAKGSIADVKTALALPWIRLNRVKAGRNRADNVGSG